MELPDDLATEAREAGLLSDAQIAALIRDRLERQKSAKFFEALDRLAAAAPEAELTPEDVNLEIRAMRAEKRRSAA